ncbi:hypothetical protein K501DRAFT_233857 [Backusella circina FSU 941]|nr:hypothetical protein K501DRAFT_233857 [Backusella circina FSU 941]
MARIHRQKPGENGKTDNVKPPQENNIGKPPRQEDQGFVHRVSSIPIVKDSVTTAQSLANKTFIGRFALSTASSVTNYAVQNQPKFLSSYYQKADALGCRSLDLIQDKVPMINQPSSDIIQAVTPYQVIDGVKVRIDTTLRTVTQPASQQLQVLQETLKQTITVYTQAAQDRIPVSVSARVHQVSQLIDNLKAQTQQVPEWLKQHIDSVIEATQQQLALIRVEFGRTDITSLEKVKHVAANIQTQIVPLLQNIQSQLATYTEFVRQKAQHDLNVPLHYFGLDQKIKTQ